MRARGVVDWVMRGLGSLYTGEGEGVKGNRAEKLPLPECVLS